MSWLFDDSFDDTNTPTPRYDVYNSANGGAVYSTANARFPALSGLTAQGVKMNPGTFVRKNLPSSDQVYYFGIAVELTGFDTTANGIPFIQFSDAGAGLLQDSFNILQNGSIGVFRNGATQVAISSPGVIQTNVYYFIEGYLAIDPTAGAAKIWVNAAQGATPLVNASSLNTRNSTNSIASQVTIGEPNNAGISVIMDDFYLFSASGSAPFNGQLGDGRFITRLPAATGDFTQWTPNGAATNWQCVNDNPPDNDTTYVSDSTVNDRDDYGLQSVSSLTTAPIYVHAKALVRKDDALAHTYQINIRNSATDAFSSSFSIGSSYAYNDFVTQNDPATGTSWTAAGFKTIQVGQKNTL